MDRFVWASSWLLSLMMMGSFVRCLEDDPYEHYVDDHYESRIAKPMVPSPVFPESQTYPRSFLGYRKRLRYQQEPKRRGVYAKSSIHELGPIVAPPPYAAFYNGANPSATNSEKIQYDNNNNQYQSYPSAVPTYGNGYGSPNNYVQGPPTHGYDKAEPTSYSRVPPGSQQLPVLGARYPPYPVYGSLFDTSVGDGFDLNAKVQVQISNATTAAPAYTNSNATTTP